MWELLVLGHFVCGIISLVIIHIYLLRHQKTLSKQDMIASIIVFFMGYVVIFILIYHVIQEVDFEVKNPFYKEPKK